MVSSTSSSSSTTSITSGAGGGGGGGGGGVIGWVIGISSKRSSPTFNVSPARSSLSKVLCSMALQEMKSIKAKPART
ncbi:MAG TPA: hypothetical protein DCS66_25855 [Flavobacteriaceae bacterium]|nr:hypothetical protein [Flavobacteriaceae bacterium]